MLRDEGDLPARSGAGGRKHFAPRNLGSHVERLGSDDTDVSFIVTLYCVSGNNSKRFMEQFDNVSDWYGVPLLGIRDLQTHPELSVLVLRSDRIGFKISFQQANSSAA